MLAKYFSSVFTEEPEGDIPNQKPINIKEKMPELIINEEMVLKQLNSLKIDKSPGPDELHRRLLKELAKSLAKPLCIIFKQSLRLKMIPKEWKKATISAILKKGNRSMAGNYRPVSLTSVVCKLLEQIIREHIIKHMKVNKLFSNKQFGFISGRSTSLQLREVLDKWIEAIDKGTDVDVKYMNFQKAFDKVPHKRLIGKAKNYVLDNPLLEWIEDFLTGRTQRESINGSTSDWKEVTSGITQGSVLGPFLFILFINDLPDGVKSDVYLFADDTKIVRNITDGEEILQDDLENLENWSNTWLLKFHPEKWGSDL